MSGIVFGLEIVVLLLMAYWAFTNDRRPAGEDQIGLFRMKSDEPGEEKAGARWRRPTRRRRTIVGDDKTPPRWQTPQSGEKD